LQGPPSGSWQPTSTQLPHGRWQLAAPSTQLPYGREQPAAYVHPVTVWTLAARSPGPPSCCMDAISRQATSAQLLYGRKQLAAHVQPATVWTSNHALETSIQLPYEQPRVLVARRRWG